MPETGHLALFKIFILALLIIASSFSKQKYPNAEVNSLLHWGINLILLQDYNSAKKQFEILLDKYPELPFGNIYLAAVEIAKSYDYSIEYDSDYILKNLSEARQLAKSLNKKNSDDIWHIYMLALAEGYTSYFDAIDGDWFAAFSSGLSCISYFEDCIEIDSNFYEAYTALGTFKYWKSRKLNFIPFLSDESEEGIKYLERAIEESSFHTYLAVNSLVWIYIDRAEPEKAIAAAEKALKQFPGNRTFQLGLARSYEDVNKKKSIEVYHQALASYQNLKLANPYKEIEIKHKLAQQYFLSGDKKKALQLCNEILNIKDIPSEVKEKLNDRLKKVIKLKEQVSS